MSEAAARAFLDEIVATGAYSAVAGRLARGGEVLWEGAAGLARPGQPATVATRFDLASLAKPFTATLALALDRSGDLPLGRKVAELWPAAHRRLAPKPLEAVLRHRGGLRAWMPLYQTPEAAAGTLRRLLEGPWLDAPIPTYSDLGYILWGEAVRAAGGEGIDARLRERVLAPLGLDGVAGPSGGDEAAWCAAGPEKEVELAAALGIVLEPLEPPPPGTPQDGNARRCGGYLGHAGLFGDLGAVHRLALEWLRPGALLDPERVRRAWSGRGPYVLGWARASAVRSAAGIHSGRARGHLGFTGGSLWIEPASELISILLGHRRSSLSDLGPIRRRWNALAAAWPGLGRR